MEEQILENSCEKASSDPEQEKKTLFFLQENKTKQNLFFLQEKKKKKSHLLDVHRLAC